MNGIKNGKVVEHGNANDMFKNPLSEYTKSLMHSSLQLMILIMSINIQNT